MIEDFNSLLESLKKCEICKDQFGFQPHPSPLNIKWFKDHPEFMEKRIIEIRKIINEVLEEGDVREVTELTTSVI